MSGTLPNLWLVHVCTHVHCCLAQEYDFVFDIEVDDGGPTMRKLKLPYNKTGEWEPWAIYFLPRNVPTSKPSSPVEDPFIAAQKFMDTNNIPAWQLDQASHKRETVLIRYV